MPTSYLGGGPTGARTWPRRPECRHPYLTIKGDISPAACHTRGRRPDGPPGAGGRRRGGSPSPDGARTPRVGSDPSTVGRGGQTMVAAAGAGIALPEGLAERLDRPGKLLIDGRWVEAA